MFFYSNDGFLWCENLRVKDIQDQVGHSPFYLYSSNQAKNNYLAYERAFTSYPTKISFAVKANGNLVLLKHLQELGCWATLVSAQELKIALAAGFDPCHLIFNGNGKTLPELRFALEYGVKLNIDSQFDLQHILKASLETKKPAKVFLRINPDIDLDVHPYISTGQKESKFGIPVPQLPKILDQLSGMPTLTLVGIHCHLGSTIDSVEIFKRTTGIMTQLYATIQQMDFPLEYINVGGGLGIDYHHKNTPFPTPTDLAEAIISCLPQDSTLIVEPGRSIIGNAGIFVCKVIGVKLSGHRNFIVTDGSMSEFIRPSLYQAFHKIDFIQPVLGDPTLFDVVGPVCESTDYLGKNRELPTPPEGTGVVVFDTGAYGYAMSSNYNARLKPPEFLVNSDKLIQIRRAEKMDDLLKLFEQEKE